MCGGMTWIDWVLLFCACVVVFGLGVIGMLVIHFQCVRFAKFLVRRGYKRAKKHH